MKQILHSGKFKTLHLKSNCFYKAGLGFNQIYKTSFLVLFFLFAFFQSYGQLATETFDSSIPTTWTAESSANASVNWVHTTDGYTTGAAVINPIADNLGQGNTASYYLITPQITAPANGQLRFFSKLSSAAGPNLNLSVMVSTASQPDISGFNVPIATLTTVTVGEYSEIVVDLPVGTNPGDQFYLAFVATNTQTGVFPSGASWFVDNVRVVEACSLIVEDVTIENITTSEATISWITTGAASYEIQVIPADQTLSNSGTITLADTYIATGLEGGTQYSVYIKSHCADGVDSQWAGPFNFATTSLGHSCDTPLVITGDSYFLFANLADYNGNHGGFTNHGANCLPAAVQDNYLNGSKIYFSYTAPEDGVINISQMTHDWMAGTECWGNPQSAVLVYEGCADVGVECIAGLYTSNTNTPETIDNLPVVGGQIYTIVISTLHASGDASVCFDFELSFTTCPAPSVFTYKNLLQESVTFSWNNPANIADSWEYVVLPVEDPAPTGAGTPTLTNNDVDITTGLTEGTAYNLYVRPICGGTPGEYSAPYRFTTQCAVFETPYSTDFVGSTAANPEPCWTSIDVNGDGVKWSYLGGWQEGYMGYATLQTSTNQNFNHDYIASPQVNFDGVTQKRLRFAHQITGGSSSSYSIKISTTGIGVDNFTYELVPETTITNTTWQEVIYNIPETIIGDVNIAWVVSPVGSGQNTTRISITNVFIEDKPACPDPLAPVLVDGSITETSAQFSWTAGDEETQWEVIAVPINDPDPTAETEGIFTTVNTNYIYENLDPAKRYKFYVRAYCSNEYQSNWVGPVNFITSCIVFPTPFYESFNDSDDNTQKFCWTLVNANGDGAQWQMGPENPSIQGSTSWFNPTLGYDDWLISPAISGTGIKELKYSYRAVQTPFFLVSRYGLQVLISHTDNDPASFVELAPLEDFTNTDYVERSIYFEASGTFYIAFRIPPDFVIDPGTSILNIDDVYINDAPDCPNPSALAVNGVLANSANFTWTQGFTETEWEIAVQPAGTGTPTESGTPVNGTASYQDTTLLSGTHYEVYVRAACDTNGFSQWVGPVTFTTLCDAFNTPFVETFNTDSATEYCWRILNINNDNYTFVTNVTSYPYEGNQSAGMFTGSNGANNDWLISPSINVTEGQRLRFYYRTNSEWYTEDLMVKMSTNGIDPSEFTTILFDSETATFDINNDYYKEMVINLPAGVIGSVNFAWHIPQMPGGPQGYRGQILMIDNVIIEDIPACPEVYNVTLSDITDTSVSVNWEVSGTETSWEVVVQPYGTEAPMAEYTHTATTHPFIVSGLDPATKYDVYVRAICTGTESNWTEPIDFNTFCSFENLCEYTITLSGASPSGVGGGINVIQNGVVVQTLNFPTGAWNAIMEPVDFVLYLCNGVEFSLFWDSIGTAPGQYPGAMVEVKNSEGVLVSSTDLGLLPAPRSTFFTGIVSCGVITCPQPTDLAVSATQEFSWTAGAAETQWEVAVQPYQNGTLPQSGTIVNTNSYMPQASDFALGNSNTYEFFVRAICGEGDESYWSGPYVFVINDDKTTAIVLQPSTGDECETGSVATLNHSSASADAMSCSGLNGGDIWYEFTATSKTHLIDLDSFSGNYYYSSGDEPHAKITLVLYEELENGDLEEIACSYSNAVATLYSTELTEGNTYKIRVVLDETYNSTYSFTICVKTITDPCNFAGINGGFEQPKAPVGFANMMSQNLITGWRYNLHGYWSNGAIFYLEALNTMGITPYEGGQLVQMFASEEDGYTFDINNVDGLYQDFDSSEITAFDYSFAHGTRGGTNTVKLYAGAPEGPFEEVHSSTVSTLGWQLREGTYQVPEGQTVTRFVFRANLEEIGNTIDGIRITNNNKIKILTADTVVSCGENLSLEAEGVGEWSVDENNPGAVIIADIQSKSTEVSGFTAPGEYTFYWKTRYCQDSVTITFEGIDEVPTVNSPIEYCQDEVAVPLTASELTGFELLFYTDEVGGTGVTSITPDTSAVGTITYYVAYVDEFGCEGARVAIEVIVNELITPIVEFSYDAIEYCTGSANPVISLATDFTIGGIFTATPTGLAIDAATGAIDLAGSDIGNYTVTYTIEENGCVQAADYTVDIAIVDTITAVVEFSYESSVCISDLNPIPTIAGDFTWGGTFSSTTGLTIDAETGEIDLAASNAGTYTVTYTVVTEDCHIGGTHNAVIVINNLIEPVVTFSYDDICITETSALPLLAQDFTLGGEFTATGIYVDPLTGEIDVTSVEVGTYTITYTIEASELLCMSSGSYSFEVTIAPCMVPKGISPNGDGLNDWFDLTGMNVRQLNIYNRYGREVYSQSNYIKEWGGKDKNGNDLPDGTYYYAIEKNDGEKLTGWVYINRSY